MKSKFTRIVFFTLLQTICMVSFCQFPGSVSSNAKLWLKSDKGVISTSGNQVTTWSNQVVNSNISTQASKVPSNHVLLQNNQFNYNPGLVYDGTIFEELRGVGTSNDWTGQLTAYSVANFTDTAFLDPYKLTSAFVSDKKGISLYADFYYADGHGANVWSAANTTPGTKNGSQIISVEYLSDNTAGSSIFRNGYLNETNTGSSIIAPVTDTFEIGGRRAFGWNTRIFVGSIGEIAVYKGLHTQYERDRINSYLALKHGLCLNHLGVSAYLNSTGNVVFTNPSGVYWNDIIGIGRDDSTGLLQKQSHQQNDKTRLYVATLANTNQANTGSFNADNQYVVMGHNNDSLNGDGFSAEYPAGQGIYNRIGREWQVTNTNFDGSFSIDIQSTIGSNVNTADLRLLVDNDGNFSNATVVNPAFTFSSGLLTISGITNAMIPMNSTRYITIASLSPNTPLPVTMLSFTANRKGVKNQLQWKVANQINMAKYAVERSANAKDYTTLSDVNATQANTEGAYSYTDEYSLSGVNYYRLKMMNKNGSYVYSNVVALQTANQQEISIYPNPVKNELFVQLTAIDKPRMLQVADALGRVVIRQMLVANGGASTININTTRLAKGSYTVMVQGSEDKAVKFMKE